MSLLIVRAECNWHPLGSAQEQAYCPLQRILVYMALELLSLKSRLTLLCKWSVHCRLHYSSTWLLSELFSCSFVEAGRLVYMTLVVRVTSASVQLCFGRCGSCTSLTTESLQLFFGGMEQVGSSTWLLSSESLQFFFCGSGTARLHGSCCHSHFSFSYALVGVGRLVISGNMSSCMLLCGWWRCDSTRLYCWMGLLGWVFGAACCDSFTYRYHSLNYFCCPFLSSELNATDILFAWRKIKEVSLWRCMY